MLIQTRDFAERKTYDVDSLFCKIRPPFCHSTGRRCQLGNGEVVTGSNQTLDYKGEHIIKLG